MRASGILSSRPKHRPTAQPGQGKRSAPITNPIPNRAMKAAVIAAFLSGKVIGNIIPNVYSAEHQTTDDPQHDSGHWSPFCHCRFKGVVNQLMHPMSRRDLRWRLILADVKSTLFTRN